MRGMRRVKVWVSPFVFGLYLPFAFARFVFAV